jgi:hypothetical protein
MSQTQRVGSTATKVTTLDGETSVKYHDTVVVRFRPGQVVLNSGGWRTATTKLRMNQAANEFGLRFQVFQSKGEWFVTHELTELGRTVFSQTLNFQDGMVLDDMSWAEA